MPRFYFHIRDPHGVIRDADGIELPSLRRAIEEAEASTRSIADQRKYEPGTCSIDVADEEGLILATIPVFLPH